MVSADSTIDESEDEISLLDLMGEPMKKKKKKVEKKGKGKRKRHDSDEERKAEKKARKKAEKGETKKVMIESLANNEKWEEALRARAVGASTSRPPITTRPNVSERREDPNGDKIAKDVVARSGTHDPRA